MADTIIFDLDGTLLDTLEDIADAMNETLAEMGYPTHPVADYNHFVGDGVEKQAARVLPEPDRYDAAIQADCVNRMHKRYRGRHVKTKPYPGIVALLSELVDQGKTLAVLSNKPHEFTLQAVAYYFDITLFKEVVGAKEHEPKKPHPKPLIDIMAALGVTRDQVLFVGDTNTDMKCAANARVNSVGVTWGFRNREELEQNGASYVVESSQELRKLLLG